MSNGVNNSFQIFRQSDPQSAAAEAGEHLNLFLAENKKLPILLMLSGGSALGILDYVGQKALGENLTVSVLDERFSQNSDINPVRSRTPKDVRCPDVASGQTSNGVNNFARLQKTEFYKDAFESESSFFGTLPRPNETIVELRDRWDKNLKAWRQENPKGLIAATLGMGPDGHTAGIFPFPENPLKFDQLFNGEAWTVAYNAESKSKYPERITATLTFLKMIDFGFAFVAGLEKREKFLRLTSGKTSARGGSASGGKTAELPAAVWHEMKNVKVFTPLEVGRLHPS